MADYANFIMTAKSGDTILLIGNHVKKIFNSESDWNNIDIARNNDNYILFGEAKNPLIFNILEQMKKIDFNIDDIVMMTYIREQEEFWSICPIKTCTTVDASTYWM